MTDRTLFYQWASHIELRVHERGMVDSYYTRAGSMLMLETYEALWIGRDIALGPVRDEPET